jgi:hypothetical protein
VRTTHQSLTLPLCGHTTNLTITTVVTKINLTITTVVTKINLTITTVVTKINLTITTVVTKINLTITTVVTKVNLNITIVISGVCVLDHILWVSQLRHIYTDEMFITAHDNDQRSKENDRITHYVGYLNDIRYKWLPVWEK